MKKDGLISQMIPLIDSVIQSQDFKSLRLVAAKHGADAPLIASGVGEIDQYINNWGYSYFLIFPALAMEGTNIDTLFISSASLWNGRNEYLYLTAESESLVKKTLIPAFSPSRRDLLAEAKTDSLKKLKSEVSKMIDCIK